MKKYWIPIACALGVLIALFVSLYPIVADYINARNQSRAVMSYLDTVASMDEDGKQAMLEAAREHNGWLLEKPDRFRFTEEETARYNRLLDTGRGVMGVLEIDKIDVKLPIYHSTDVSVLQIGIGHMPSSSLPVGGTGTHAFITGHRGLPSSKLLTHLDKMAEGDIFVLYILDDILTYRVDEIKTVLPEDARTQAIDPGGDYCTLVTCTPYGVNTHRLLVRGHRIETTRHEPLGAEAHRLNKLLALPFFLSPALLALLVFAAAKCIQISRGGKAKWPNDMRV